MSSSLITLNVSVNRSQIYKEMEFERFSLIRDICCSIRRISPEIVQGDHCGLFRPHQDPAKGYWLEMNKTLEDYFLNNGDVLEYRTKIRPLCVYTLEKFVKIVSIDDSQSLLRVTQLLCSKLGLQNWEEFSFTADISNDDGAATRSLKDHMGGLKKKYCLGDKLNWLIPEKTLREQGITETKVITLRKKFFYTDLDMDQSNTVQLNLIYVQSRDAILHETHPCTKQEAILLAALQCHIQYGKHDSSEHEPGLFTLTDILPKGYVRHKNIKMLIWNEYKKLWNITDVLEAKYNYIQLCGSLPTYGITCFLVKDRLRGRTKNTPCLLGVGRSSIMRLDVKTKNIVTTWPLSTVQRWNFHKDSFSLNFGQHIYTCRTTEGERISDFLSSYAYFISKSHLKTQGTGGLPPDQAEEDEVIMQDCMAYDLPQCDSLPPPTTQDCVAYNLPQFDSLPPTTTQDCVIYDLPQFDGLPPPNTQDCVMYDLPQFDSLPPTTTQDCMIYDLPQYDSSLPPPTMPDGVALSPHGEGAM